MTISNNQFSLIGMHEMSQSVIRHTTRKCIFVSNGNEILSHSIIITGRIYFLQQSVQVTFIPINDQQIACHFPQHFQIGFLLANRMFIYREVKMNV